MATFFPNLGFAWAFVAVLFAFLAAATYMDLTVAIIPKWASVAAWPVGIAFNMIRCGWLASQPMPHTTWLWKDASPLLGTMDGFLFSVAGLCFGFGFYTILWILGVAGGGDVKLCAAIGAWLGPMLTLYVIIVSIVIVFIIVLANGAYSLARGNLRSLRKPTSLSAEKRARRLLTFSLPLFLATIVVLFSQLRHELGIVLNNAPTVTVRS